MSYLAKKRFGIFIVIFSSLLLILQIAAGVVSNNDYVNKHENYWVLADRSSSITEKYHYIDKMVKSFENSKMKGEYNAIWIKNPANSFDNNLKALVSLRDRLDEIQTMDVSSFEYQTAISQITEQEQGEAAGMLSILQGCWYKEYHFLLWNWVAVTIAISLIVLIIIGAVIWANNNW